MPRRKDFSDPAAFRRSLEDRIRAIAREESVAAGRVRRLVVFDRFLARLIEAQPDGWVLKGGYAMELRFTKARSTNDIDVTYQIGSPSELDLLDELQRAAMVDLSDFFSFTVSPAQLQIQGAPYGGVRFPIVSIMAGREFERFSIDVAIADPPEKPKDELAGRPWLDFAGIPAPMFPAISREQQFAEKLHAYTVPRDTPNSRVRDLVDMVILVDSGELDVRETVHALSATFMRRDTHGLPSSLVDPPTNWNRSFAAMATECGIEPDMLKAFAPLKNHVNGLLRDAHLRESSD